MTRCRGGFAIFYVLLILVLVGAGVIVLSNGSRRLQDETSRLESDACRRSLIASGQAWAALHAQDTPAQGRTLDVTALGIPEAELSVAAQPQGVSIRFRHWSRYQRKVVSGEQAVSPRAWLPGCR